MTIPPLHGATGAWDELICLVLPATLIVAVALAVLRGDRQLRADNSPKPDQESAAPLPDATQSARTDGEEPRRRHDNDDM